jgi:hypothetical protein
VATGLGVLALVGSLKGGTGGTTSPGAPVVAQAAEPVVRVAHHAAKTRHRAVRAPHRVTTRHRNPKPRMARRVVHPAAPARACNPNYSGCLKPDAADYDCLGGSGDGPEYTGPVTVTGYDEYGLDRDGDGVGCDT